MTGLPLDSVSVRLLGPAGTPVRVTFERRGRTESVTTGFIRAVIRVPGIPYAIMLEPGVGYIPLESFNQSAASGVEHAVLTPSARGARSFVLGVRGIGGGSLDQSLAISNLFASPARHLATVRHRGRAPELFRATAPH